MPPIIRSKFTELLSSSVAAEFRKVCADISNYKAEVNYGESRRIYANYTHMLQELRAQYQSIIEDRAERADLTMLEKGLPVMFEKQLEAAAELASPRLDFPEEVVRNEVAPYHVAAIESRSGFFNPASNHFYSFGSDAVSPEGMRDPSQDSCLPGCVVC